jgi:O-antigen/teichoic acid export membrane protein
MGQEDAIPVDADARGMLVVPDSPDPAGLRWPRFLQRNRLLWSVLQLAGGTALGQGVIIVASPLLTRLYSPDDFGVLVVYVSLLSFLLGVATLRYQMAIPLIRQRAELASLLVLCVVVLLGMTTLVALIALVFGHRIIDWVNAPRLQSFLWLVPLSFAGAGAFQMLSYWAIRNGEFGVLGRTRLMQSGGQAMSQLVLGVFSVGAFGLLIGDAIGRATGSLRLARMVGRELGGEFRQVDARSVWQVARRYQRFPLISSGSGLLASAGMQFPTLLIASLYGSLVVGWFGLCQRLLSMSFSLVASSIGLVFFSEAAALARDNPVRLMQFFWKTVLRATGLASVLIIGVVLVAPFLFGPLFGREWAEAGNFAQVLAFSAGFGFVNRTVGGAALVVERQDIDLLCEITNIGFGSGALLLGGALGLGPLHCMVCYAVGDSIGSMTGLSLSWIAIRRTIDRWNTRMSEVSEMELPC